MSVRWCEMCCRLGKVDVVPVEFVPLKMVLSVALTYALSAPGSGEKTDIDFCSLSAAARASTP